MVLILSQLPLCNLSVLQKNPVDYPTNQTRTSSCRTRSTFLSEKYIVENEITIEVITTNCQMKTLSKFQTRGRNFSEMLRRSYTLLQRQSTHRASTFLRYFVTFTMLQATSLTKTYKTTFFNVGIICCYKQVHQLTTIEEVKAWFYNQWLLRYPLKCASAVPPCADLSGYSNLKQAGMVKVNFVPISLIHNAKIMRKSVPQE